MCNFNCLSDCITQIFSLIWIFILWLPYVFYYYAGISFDSMSRQLTWWSWTVQALFYTTVFFLTNKTCTKIYSTECMQYINDTISILWNNDCMRKVIDYMPDKGDYLGIVSGMVWFVLLNFCYVLSTTPSLVHNVASTNKSTAGWVQIGNILIHYYTVSALPLWTIAMFDRVRTYMHKYMQNNICFKRIRFTCGWIIVLLLYVSRWGYDFNGILKNYELDKQPFLNNMLIILSMIPVVVIINIVFLHMITQDITHKKIVIENEELETV